MGIWRRILGMSDAPGRWPAEDDRWWAPVQAAWATPAGQPVTPDRALHLTVVQACLRVLAQPLAALPLVIYRRQADGSKERVADHPIYDVLHHRPNSRHTAAEFRGTMQWNLGLHGNAYAQIVPGPRGAVDQLLPLSPPLVTPRRRPSGGVTYEVRDDASGGVRQLDEQEVWHLRALPLQADGITGTSPVEMGRHAIGKALGVAEYGARFFANDGTSGGIIEFPGQFKDPEQRKTFLEAWRKARTGANAHRTAVLEFGAKFVASQVTNENAQFLETRKEEAADVARIWGVPPHKVGILDRATFNNIEHLGLEFVTDTLLPWLVLWEQSIKANLIVGDDAGDVFAEFNVAGLLRGDQRARFAAYAQGRQWGWLSVNDVRALENLNPVEGGDVYMQPINMAPIDGSQPLPETDPAEPSPDDSKPGQKPAQDAPPPSPPGPKQGRRLEVVNA